MNVILFGATGMVGQAVLRECLRDEGVEKVVIIGRRSTRQTHAKITELLLEDMFDVESARSQLPASTPVSFAWEYLRLVCRKAPIPIKLMISLFVGPMFSPNSIQP